MMVWLLACIGKGGIFTGDSGPDSADPAPQDMVLVLDASASMQEETAALLLAVQDMSTDGDQLWAVTTVEGDAAGEFMREPTAGPDELLAALACDAACWSASELPSDPTYVCGEPADEVSVQFLDCLCGIDPWEGHCGSGVEEPLEAIYGAICRATDGCEEFDTQSGLLRSDATTHFAVFTDEGDSSRRLTAGDGSAGTYLDLYDETGHDYRISAMGPAYDADAGTLLCNDGGATTWGTSRLQEAAKRSGGSYAYLAHDDAGGECEMGDVAAFLGAL